MAIPNVRKAVGVALSVAAAAVALTAVGWALSDRADCAAASAPVAGAARTETSAAGSVVVTSTPISEKEVMITLVDTSRDRLAVYVADARTSRLKLLAVRDISADWALTDFNNEPPLPKDLRQHVEKSAPGRPPLGAETPAPLFDAGSPEKKPEDAP